MKTTPKDIKHIHFWIYDYRKQCQENLWNSMLIRHNDCVWERTRVRQVSGYPKIHITLFKCFNCGGECFQKYKRRRVKRRIVDEGRLEISERWND